ncbi:MAG: DUF1844 domain-containing protein [Phycisphaeraceae bacterium]|nr:DUF1844 domain-containing protein [Phycisphaeraceae bacterium]
MSEDSGIQIDSDWKAEARAEKERLKEKSAPASAGPSAASPGTPGTPGTPGSGATEGTSVSPGATAGDPRSGARPADFQLLVSTLASPALFYLGEYPDPQSGRRAYDLDAARTHIDLLGVLEEKTRDTLSDDESAMLAGILYDLRSRYIQVARASTRTGVSRE